MKAVEFVGQTHHFGPPTDWNIDRPTQCGALPVLVVADDDQPMLISIWKPSKEDIAALADGACVRLVIFGAALPPVSVDVIQAELLP